MTDHSHDNWKPASNPWAVAIVVTLAVFMAFSDGKAEKREPLPCWILSTWPSSAISGQASTETSTLSPGFMRSS